MAVKIRRLPGKSCVYYKSGRCLYEERLNPGFHRQWRCKILLRWEAAYDNFLLQADIFNLDQETATRIWEERLRRLMRSGRKCPDFILGGDDEITGCASLFGSLCLKLLPLCDGQCRLYHPKGKKIKKHKPQKP